MGLGFFMGLVYINGFSGPEKVFACKNAEVIFPAVHKIPPD
jgi:hypothetical protein